MRKIIIGWIWIPVVILLISSCSEAQQAHKEPVPTPVISSVPQILASTNPAMDDP